LDHGQLKAKTTCWQVMVFKRKALRNDFGKRRATRENPWLAVLAQPFRRLGALVFRLGPIRKSHNGLTPIGSDQDPDSRLCDRFYLLPTPAGKTFSLFLLGVCVASPVPPNQGITDLSKEKVF